MDPNNNRLPHLMVSGRATREPYTFPGKVVKTAAALPRRDRRGHAEALQQAFEQLEHESHDLLSRRRAIGLRHDGGLKLAFQSAEGFELAVGSLENSTLGFRLDAVVVRDNVTWATVTVEPGKLGAFKNYLVDYAERDTEQGKPKNQALIESIEAISWAAVDSLWTDDVALRPPPDEPHGLELWVRAEDERVRVKRGRRLVSVTRERASVLADFRAAADALGIELDDDVIHFPDRAVYLARTTLARLSESIQLLDALVEIRLAKDMASFFEHHVRRPDQAEWVKTYREQLRLAPSEAPAVCVLDTGVSWKHPLLEDSLAEDDVLTCDPSWGLGDDERHGTLVAGLALHGDLAHALVQSGPVPLEHRLESVKIRPALSKRIDTADMPLAERLRLWGAVTEQGVARIEIARPRRRRVFSFTSSTDETATRGAPSSWSAVLDKLAMGVDGPPRLVCVAAGNLEPEAWKDYPNVNLTTSVHDPGQSWNALTIGACTEHCHMELGGRPGAAVLALPDTLAPSSTTSTLWEARWPFKPDIVLEGGNGVRTSEGSADSPEELSLLSTHPRPTERLLAAMGDTSAATGLAARMAAQLMARYPDLWPEAIRALMVHSARWTRNMKAEAERANGLEYLLRVYGYGKPDLERAAWSATNVLTLIAQESLQPFKAKKDRIVTDSLNLHDLPWPTQTLKDLGDTKVTLRVTLSYFIEPNPGERGWKYKHRYASHGLRFALIKPGEEIGKFRARVSKDAQDEEEGLLGGGGEPGWAIGKNRRVKGSVHSDTWTGKANELADRRYLAVFPVGGWWKERKALKRWNQPIRYALLVSIEAPEVEVDLYTPVRVQIEVPVEIEI